jgi:hypothetical protein
MRFKEFLIQEEVHFGLPKFHLDIEGDHLAFWIPSEHHDTGLTISSIMLSAVTFLLRMENDLTIKTEDGVEVDPLDNPYPLTNNKIKKFLIYPSSFISDMFDGDDDTYSSIKRKEQDAESMQQFFKRVHNLIFYHFQNMQDDADRAEYGGEA